MLLIPSLLLTGSILVGSPFTYPSTQGIQEIIDTAPLCEVEEIRIKKKPKGVGGSATRGRITVATNDVGLSLEHIVLHECGHIVMFNMKNKVGMRKIFGKGEYVSDYANKSYHEDFAESYRFYVQNFHLVPRKEWGAFRYLHMDYDKFHFLNRMLR